MCASSALMQSCPAANRPATSREAYCAVNPDTAVSAVRHCVLVYIPSLQEETSKYGTLQMCLVVGHNTTTLMLDHGEGDID